VFENTLVVPVVRRGTTGVCSLMTNIAGTRAASTRAAPLRIAATLGVAVATFFPFVPSPLQGQSTADHPTDVVTTAAGEQYSAGPLRRWILGRHYRDLWTTPIRVELLDLDNTAGGLTPTRTGGGMQTRSLRFMGADGREYAFRSVDKDPSAVLDSLLQETLIGDLVQDGISAAHPFGALVAGPLMDAVGLLHVDPQLRVMPDDPRLGEFREEFAGMLGLMEERPDENSGDRTAFAGTERVIASEALTERLDRGPADRVDAASFLQARILDVFLGDWDRHRGQWRWATYDDSAPRTWLPIPRDRDQAFSKFDGLATRIVSIYMPQFVRFEAEYPSMTRLHWNGRALDRWLLAELDRPAWDSIGSEVQAALTDEVLLQATFQLPLEIYEINGVELEITLRKRRDTLNEAWGELYRIMSEKVDVHATNADEVVVVDHSERGSVLISMTVPEESDEPYFSRRFLESETREVRIYLKDGDDQVTVSGQEDMAVRVRIIGGDDDNVYAFNGSGSDVALYDSEGDNVVSGTDAPKVNDKPMEVWEWSPEDRNQPRDWGKRTLPIFWSSFSSDLGLFIGGGAHFESYGFQKRGFATAFDVRGGYGTAAQKGILEFDARMNTENSSFFWTMGGRASRLDVLSYYGLGNDTPSGGEEFHEVDITLTSASFGMGLAPKPWLEITGGVVLERSSTQDNTGRFFDTLGDVYGAGGFVSVGLGGELVVDPLPRNERSGNRLRLRIHGYGFPEVADVESSFGRVGGDISVLVASSTWPRLSLAMRGGSVKLLGNFPWHKAAFIGGTSTVRGWDENRFAGEGAVYGSAELRLRLVSPRVIVPIGVGVFGFADTGRVFLESESPGGWHTGLGGGLFFQPVQQQYIMRFGAGVSDEATKIFLAFGLPY